QGRSLAAREAAHDAQRIVPPDAKAREVLARGFDREITAHAADLVDGGEVGVHLSEVLIEVPILKVRAALHVAAILREAAIGEDLEERGLASAVRAHHADALAAAHEDLDAVEEDAAAALGVEVLAIEDDVARARGGGEAKG